MPETVIRNYGEDDVEIDSDIVELIDALNKYGIKTTNCCSGHEELMAYISIDLNSFDDIAFRRLDKDNSELIIWWPFKGKKPNRKEVCHSEVD